jgi:hypothetical protein
MLTQKAPFPPKAGLSLFRTPLEHRARIRVAAPTAERAEAISAYPGTHAPNLEYERWEATYLRWANSLSR